MNHGQLARRRELENAAIAARAALRGRAVEIACGVRDQPSLRVCPVLSACEGVEHGLDAIRRQLEDDAAIARSSAVNGRAVEIARCVLDEARQGFVAVATSPEGIEHRLRTAGGDFKHDAVIVGAALMSYAEMIARGQARWPYL